MQRLDAAQFGSFDAQIGRLAHAQMVQHCLVNLPFEGDTGEAVFNPGNLPHRSLDSANFHRHSVTQTGKARSAADFASAFGYVDQINIYFARLNPPLHKKVQRTALA